MAKLNVYIPDDLAKTVRAVGAGWNLSAIFRKALEAEIEARQGMVYVPGRWMPIENDVPMTEQKGGA